MKAVILYCDRCAGEGKGEVRALHIVWIRTSHGGRPLRLDVCADHFAMIVGEPSPNGAAPPLPGERVWGTRRSAGLERKAYERLGHIVAKQARFSYADAQAYVGKDYPKGRVDKALHLLVEDGKLERYAQGIYQRPGFTMPEPASVEQAAAAVVKVAKAQPGIPAVVGAGLAGIESTKLWRATLDYLRAHKRMRTKGYKSAMRLYAL